MHNNQTSEEDAQLLAAEENMQIQIDDGSTIRQPESSSTTTVASTNNTWLDRLAQTHPNLAWAIDEAW